MGGLIFVSLAVIEIINQNTRKSRADRIKIMNCMNVLGFGLCNFMCFR